MTPLDRYLNCVRRYLPSEQRDDITSELRANLLAQFEEMQISSSEPAQSAYLKQYGSPLVIAARYRNDQRRIALGRELIGPALFPVFLCVLRTNILVGALACIVVGIVFSSGFPGTLRAMFIQLVVQSFIVTLIFAAANHHLTKSVTSKLR